MESLCVTGTWLLSPLCRGVKISGLAVIWFIWASLESYWMTKYQSESNSMPWSVHSCDLYGAPEVRAASYCMADIAKAFSEVEPGRFSLHCIGKVDKVNNVFYIKTECLLKKLVPQYITLHRPKETTNPPPWKVHYFGSEQGWSFLFVAFRRIRKDWKSSWYSSWPGWRQDKKVTNLTRQHSSWVL